MHTEGFGIDSRIGAAATRAPVASREDYRPQAILKFQLRISFNYRVRYKLQLFNQILPLQPRNYKNWKIFLVPFGPLLSLMGDSLLGGNFMRGHKINV